MSKPRVAVDYTETNETRIISHCFSTEVRNEKSRLTTANRTHPKAIVAVAKLW
jgi:hypothetical protein